MEPNSSLSSQANFVAISNPLDAWIALAMRAPSGDNCQPWAFTFFDDHFRVAIDSQRSEHFLDQNQSAAWLSLGCLCENLRISAEHFGFSCNITLESEHSVVVDYSRIPQVKNESLSEAILKRQTYRGPLKSASLDLTEYQNRFKNFPRAQRYQWKPAQNVSSKLLWKWAWLESVLWLKTPLMRDFTKWIHFKKEKFDDGLTLENLQVSLLDQLTLVIFKKFPALVKLVPFLIFKIQTYFRLKFLVENSAGLIVLSGPFMGYEDYFYAGMELQRMWVYLTEKKLKAQPFAIQSLFLNFANSKENQQILSAKQIKKIEEIKVQTSQEFQLNQNLIFALRFGKTESEIPALPRRTIERTPGVKDSVRRAQVEPYKKAH